MPCKRGNHYPGRGFAAAGSLAKLKAVEPLIEVLNHNDKRVRFQAVWALGDIRDLKAVEPLSQLTEDEDKEVSEAALRALKQIHS
ncbi:HEAT repeat domain-containing protein [Tolypothrix sp. VBCCA 56010]|uniref:HEAT repeat domain-containing protein n=1 Tax=Tolypothrix sp. VBCCA 56010 TaxID=3137731 RepID=UPI003D7D8AF4